MRVILLGTGYAIQTAERVHTSILMDLSENLLLFDCGSGVLHRLAQAGYDSTDISAVFHTHHHLDHNSDLLPLLKTNWLKGKTDMRIFGPVGTKAWLDKLFDAFSYLQGRFNLEVTELSAGDAIKLGDDIVECKSAEHGPYALAYKVTSKGVSTVYSGDTEPCAGITELSQGADLLIHECNFLTEDMRGIKGHSNPVSLGEAYGDIGAKRLALVHLPSEIVDFEDQVLSTISKYFKGEILIGKDLLTLEL
ncbi:MAG: MBL fold metallo-hydrolase [Candidatus Hydrothermarchaeales archaeon]